MTTDIPDLRGPGRAPASSAVRQVAGRAPTESVAPVNIVGPAVLGPSAPVRARVAVDRAHVAVGRANIDPREVRR